MHRVATVDGLTAPETLAETKKKFELSYLLFAILHMWAGSERYPYNLVTQGDGNDETL